jgi:hypothetical protein
MISFLFLGGWIKPYLNVRGILSFYAVNLLAFQVYSITVFGYWGLELLLFAVCLSSPVLVGYFLPPFAEERVDK